MPTVHPALLEMKEKKMGVRLLTMRAVGCFAMDWTGATTELETSQGARALAQTPPGQAAEPRQFAAAGSS